MAGLLGPPQAAKFQAAAPGGLCKVRSWYGHGWVSALVTSSVTSPSTALSREDQGWRFYSSCFVCKEVKWSAQVHRGQLRTEVLLDITVPELSQSALPLSSRLSCSFIIRLNPP